MGGNDQGGWDGEQRLGVLQSSVVVAVANAVAGSAAPMHASGATVEVGRPLACGMDARDKELERTLSLFLHSRNAPKRPVACGACACRR